MSSDIAPAEIASLGTSQKCYPCVGLWRRGAGPGSGELGSRVDPAVRAGVPGGRRDRDDRAVLHPYPRRRFNLLLLLRQPHPSRLDEPRSPLLRRNRRAVVWRRRAPSGRRASHRYGQRSADHQSHSDSAKCFESHLTPLNSAARSALVLKTPELRHHYTPWNCFAGSLKCEPESRVLAPAARVMMNFDCALSRETNFARSLLR